MEAVVRQKAALSKEISSAKRNGEREAHMVETMLELLTPFTERLKEVDAQSSNRPAGGNSKRDVEAHSQDAKSPSWKPMRGGTLW